MFLAFGPVYPDGQVYDIDDAGTVVGKLDVAVEPDPLEVEPEVEPELDVEPELPAPVDEEPEPDDWVGVAPGGKIVNSVLDPIIVSPPPCQVA